MHDPGAVGWEDRGGRESGADSARPAASGPDEMRVRVLEAEVAGLRAALTARGDEEREQAAVIEAVRRRVESSFVATSDTLVRVRTAIRILAEWRKTPSAGGAGTHLQAGTGSGPPLGDGSGPPPAERRPAPADEPGPLAGALEAVAGDLGRLAGRAADLRALAAAAGPLGATPAREPGPEPRPPAGGHPTQVARASPAQVHAVLKLPVLAAELESGLQGLAAEVRALRRAELRRPQQNGGSPERSGGIGLERTLERLELQLSEVAEGVAALTSDAEHLSRQLGRRR